MTYFFTANQITAFKNKHIFLQFQNDKEEERVTIIDDPLVKLYVSYR